MKIEECSLFRNTNLDLSKIQIEQYPSEYTIAIESDVSENIGIILEGRVLVKAYTLGGNNFTLNTLLPGQIFGDILMFSDITNTFPGSLITQSETKIAYIPNELFQEYLFTNRILLRNFLRLFSDKAYEMNYKSKLLSQDTVRDKILFYLYNQRKIQKSRTIVLGMTKEELANQLFIQRPSLSRELIKMKKDGLIDYDLKTITMTTFPHK